MDHDGGDDDFIDEIKITLQFSGVVLSEPARSYLGTYSIANLTLAYEFHCANNYFGSDCTVYCEDTDSDVDGHFLCDENGNKVCRYGYQGPSSNCVLQTLGPGESQV